MMQHSSNATAAPSGDSGEENKTAINRKKPWAEPGPPSAEAGKRRSIKATLGGAGIRAGCEGDTFWRPTPSEDSIINSDS